MTSDISAALSAAVVGHRLLDHPFYRRWEEGGLGAGELARYAEEYRHFEAALPQALAIAVAGSDGRAAELAAANLDDERFRPRPHVELFEGFARAAGAADPAEQSVPGSAMAALVALYGEAAADSPVAALSVIGAYERQAADIAATKARSLRERYGMGPDGTEFWTVHAAMEDQHADWTVEALESLDADPGEVARWADRSALAWWSFLDERQLAA